MRSMTQYIAAAFLMMLVMSCGGGSQQTMQTTTEGEVPDWYLNKPEDPNFLYEPATATSQDMQLAVDKAVQAGRTGIGRQVETKIQAIQKRFQEETGVGEDAQLLDQMTQASKTVVSTSLTGSKEINKKIVKDGKMWRAYVLVQYPLGAAQEAFKAQIKKNEQAYTRFRATQTFKELDDEVAKYEAWKKDNKQ
ncbi:MAG TPA: hypothetical protein VK470_10515 [Bacteroidota bacterium]|nr:hypothetical protein [Bacteroidota bacterium]